MKHRVKHCKPSDLFTSWMISRFEMLLSKIFRNYIVLYLNCLKVHLFSCIIFFSYWKFGFLFKIFKTEASLKMVANLSKISNVVVGNIKVCPQNLLVCWNVAEDSTCGLTMFHLRSFRNSSPWVCSLKGWYKYNWPQVMSVKMLKVATSTNCWAIQNRSMEICTRMQFSFSDKIWVKGCI